MKYKNTKTGAIIDSPCTIFGGDWVEYKKEIAKEVEIEEVDDKVEVAKVVGETKETVEDVEEEIEGIEGITVKEIKQELDAFGIKYSAKAKKQELYDLMVKGR